MSFSNKIIKHFIYQTNTQDMYNLNLLQRNHAYSFEILLKNLRELNGVSGITVLEHSFLSKFKIVGDFSHLAVESPESVHLFLFEAVKCDFSRPRLQRYLEKRELGNWYVVLTPTGRRGEELKVTEVIT